MQIYINISWNKISPFKKRGSLWNYLNTKEVIWKAVKKKKKHRTLQTNTSVWCIKHHVSTEHMIIPDSQLCGSNWRLSALKITVIIWLSVSEAHFAASKWKDTKCSRNIFCSLCANIFSYPLLRNMFHYSFSL